MDKHFCTCNLTKCAKHPSNHSKGCDPCIESNLKQMKMPTCFFLAVDKDVSDVKEYTFKGFVEFCQKRTEKPD